MEQVKILILVAGLPGPAHSINRERLITWTEVQVRAMKEFSSWKECLF